MKKNRNRNYTVYWMAGISAVLTAPIAVIIVRGMQAGSITKTVLIVSTFVFIFTAIMLLYKNIFGVSVQEITQEDKVTELDRLGFTLEQYRKKYSNIRVRKSIDIAIQQIQRFKRRKEVMLQVSGEEIGSNDSSALSNLVQSVEDVLEDDLRRMINRIEIFDDYAVPEVMGQNIGFIEDRLFKIDEVLMEFEKLITETSRMGETREEADVSNLKDVIDAMKKLRTDHDDEMDDLTKKYDKQ